MKVSWEENMDNHSLTLENNTIVFPQDPFQFSICFQVFISILYNGVFLLAVLGNTLVIYVVLSSPRMRTVTNFLIVNLALGDLLMALLCVPFSYISVLMQYWPFGKMLCHIVSPAQATCVFVSAYTLTALAVDRFIAILYPMRPKVTKFQVWVTIGLIWIVAMLTAIPIAFYTELNSNEQFPLCEESGWFSEDWKFAYSLTLMILQYFLPIFVLLFTYSKIAIAIWGKKSLGEEGTARGLRFAQAKRKIIKMMLVVVGIYTLSWLPFNCFIILVTMYPTHPILYTDTVAHLYFLFHLLAMAHTVTNPFVYCWMNEQFREGFHTTLGKVPGVNRCFFKGVRSSSYSQGQEMNHLRRSGTCSTHTFSVTTTNTRSRNFGSTFV